MSVFAGIAVKSKEFTMNKTSTTPDKDELKPSNSGELDELRKHFEANMLDGDAIQAGQMLASSEVFGYIAELVPQQIKKFKQALEEQAHTLHTKHGCIATSALNSVYGRFSGGGDE